MFICPLDLKCKIMALLPNGVSSPGYIDNISNPPSSFYKDPNYQASTPDNGISQPQSLEEFLNKVRSTQIYQTAYRAFSSDPDSTYWLGQLQSILDSVTLPDNNVFDRWNWSNAYDDKVAKLYNEVISAISQLYANWKQHRNSLPITGVMQDAEAGINSAITGQIHGSQLESQRSSMDAYNLPSGNGLQDFIALGSFALDTVNGLTGVMSSFADVALKFQDLDLRRQQFGLSKDDLALRKRAQDFNETKSFADFKKSMSDSGVILNSSSWSELEELDPNWNDNAPSRAKALHNMYLEIMQGLQYGPVVSSASTSGEYSDSSLWIENDPEGGVYSRVGSTVGSYGYYLSRDYADLGKMQMDLAMAEAMRRVDVGNTNLDEGLTPEEVAQATAREQKANSNYNARKAVIFLDRLDKLVQRSRNGDPVASVEIINLMQSADWQESAVYMLGEMSTDTLQLVGGGLSDISSWSAENFAKVINFFKDKIQ